MAITTPPLLPSGGPALPTYPALPGPQYIPLPAIPDVEAIYAEAKAQAERSARALTTRFGLPAGMRMPPSPWELTEATARRITAELGIPLPTKLSVNGLLQMVGGFPGLPFPIPARLPTDAGDFLETGLQVAASYFGPQLFAAVGLGAIAPGIGNAVGVAIALAKYIAFALTQEDPAARYLCRPPGDLWRSVSVNRATPLLQMAYAQAALSEARRVRSTPTEYRQYQPEMVSQCMTDLQYRIRYRYYPMVAGSADKTILPQALKALEMFNLAEGAYGRLEPEAQRIRAELQNRVRYIQWLIGEYDSVTKAAVPTSRLGAAMRMGRTASVQTALLQEASNASVSAQLAGTAQPFWRDQALGQFALATSFFSGLAPYQERFTALFNELGGGAPPPARTQAEHDAQMQRWQATDASYNTATTTNRFAVQLAPSVAASLKLSQTVRDAVKCASWYAAWAEANPGRARCVDAETERAILGLCDLAGQRKISSSSMVSEMLALVERACRRAPPPSVVVEGTPGGVLVRAFAFTGNPFRLFHRERT